MPSTKDQKKRYIEKLKREDPEKLCKLRREAKARYKAKHPEKFRESKQRYKQKYPEKHRAIVKKSIQNTRYEVLSHYSGGKEPICANCGTKYIEFLEISNVNGYGKQLKREINGSLPGYLKKNGFPDGFEVLCSNCNAKKTKTIAKQNSEDGTRTQKSHYKKYYRMKQRVFEHYAGPTGIKCACCGESDFDVLCLDHINGDGAEHRRSLGKHIASQMYKWVIQNNYPPMFRILCSNCNQSLGHHGYCPHEKYSDYNTIQPSLRIMQI